MRPNAPTSLRVSEVRAQILHTALLEHGNVTRIEDLTEALPRFALWRPSILDAAVAALVADGRITEDSAGRLRVFPQEPGA